MEELQRYINILVENGYDVDKEIKVFYNVDKNKYEVECCDNFETAPTLQEVIEKQISSIEEICRKERLI